MKDKKSGDTPCRKMEHNHKENGARATDLVTLIRVIKAMRTNKYLEY